MKTKVYLGAEMALFGTTSQTYQPDHSFQHFWWTFVIDASVTPATVWQTEEENTCQHSICLQGAKGFNAAMTDP